MRIVAGRHRGRSLAAPEGDAVRPTSDRAREALFNILEHGRFATGGAVFREARVLDGFAGTGAVGLEALSRGAAHAVFFERAPAALAALKANIRATGETARTTILTGDIRRPPKASAPCRFVFLDPPYGEGLGGPALAALAAQGWVDPAGLAVLEVAAREAFEPPEGFEIVDERRYGAARLVFLKPLHPTTGLP